jgi:hypothetical protein
MCVAATHCMAVNQHQPVRNKSAVHAACNPISVNGRKRSRGSIRISTRLRPTPEIAIQKSKEAGSSQRATAITCGR